jgi:2-polyprenyl-6-methoxyphenol hydroxylase-like FAD-dependent oxidoreductase
MPRLADVVIVGGGIGGASLALALAANGLGVTVIESTVEYPDRVRGECLMPWGANEARRLGAEDVLLKAGARVSPLFVEYAEGVGRTAEIHLDEMVPGVPGALAIGHPDACQALVSAAAEAGATVVRGAGHVEITSGHPVQISYRFNGALQTVKAPLVIGADGRNSAVRRQAGIRLRRQHSINYAAGLLVELEGVPDDFDIMATEGDFSFGILHQRFGRARVYLFFGLSGQHRFSGPGARARFTEACRLSCVPWGEQIARAVPIGPCATFPGDDTWTPHPYAEGIVLIGDAAGHNDPIAAQGLSIALRDARSVRDLILAEARQPSDFTPYGTERSERMERLRLVADVLSVAKAEDADNRSARRAYFDELVAAGDPQVSLLLRGIFAGPETIPAELVRASVLERLRSAKGAP